MSEWQRVGWSNDNESPSSLMFCIEQPYTWLEHNSSSYSQFTYCVQTIVKIHGLNKKVSSRTCLIHIRVCTNKNHKFTIFLLHTLPVTQSQTIHKKLRFFLGEKTMVGEMEKRQILKNLFGDSSEDEDFEINHELNHQADSVFVRFSFVIFSCLLSFWNSLFLFFF